MGKHVPKE